MDTQTRQEYIRAAVTFLQNPKLVDSSLKDKINFLKGKGLSEIEVDEALNLALINRQQQQNGKWNFLLILGLCVGGYKLYKVYQESRERYMTQHKEHELKRQRVEELKAKQDQEKEKIPNIVEIMAQLSELKKLLELQRHNFDKDMQSLKTLLLGHEKFAAPPSIPAWQLEDDKKEE